jgi:hypothetical protein
VSELQIIEQFVERVNRRAEAEMLKTGSIAGAHHRAIEAELAILRAPSVSAGIGEL